MALFDQGKIMCQAYVQSNNNEDGEKLNNTKISHIFICLCLILKTSFENKLCDLKTKK